jgi:hypothetical protein
MPLACAVVVAAARWAGQWIRFLFGTEAHDPAAISAVVLLLFLVAARLLGARAPRPGSIR